MTGPVAETADDQGDPAARRLVMPSSAGAVGAARDFARQALTGFGWLPAQDASAQTTADDLLLLVSELVTNACRHGAAPYRLTLEPKGADLRVEVADSGAELPTVRPDQPEVPGGFGMRLVEQLAGAWGVRTDEVGKTVWLEIAR
jgi:anti-sigma regulatory factor (Ser/Thr protein kinase)